MNSRTFRALMALGLLSLAPSAFAAEAFDNCTGFIDSLPTTISTQGTWCLRKDLATAMTVGNAITVNAPNVTIDCNGYKVGGLSGGVGTDAIGIFADRSNTVIRHCNVRGFNTGAVLFGSAAVVEDNRFEGNTHIGVSVWYGGTIRRNQVISTGGSTLNSNNAVGIMAENGVDVIDNTVDGVMTQDGGGATYGILLYGNHGASVAGNRVRNVGSSVGDAWGIHASLGTRETIVDNQVVGLGTGDGIVCQGTLGVTMGNTIAGFGTGMVGCTDDGANVVAN
jgi:nitrous oxidase accessory protein NosD